jgi:hypothetical protein
LRCFVVACRVLLLGSPKVPPIPGRQSLFHQWQLEHKIGASACCNMTSPFLISRERCEQHADECLDLVIHSTDGKIRTIFTPMPKAWSTLAEEIERSRQG